MGKQTDEILSEITNRTSDVEQVDFVDETMALRELRKDIEASSSLTKFANECGIQTSHLCDFLNKKKNISRDRLLPVFIHLHYNLEKTQTMLHRLNLPELYVRNKRDYQIAVGIRDGKSIDEIEEILLSENLESIFSDTAKKE